MTTITPGTHTIDASFEVTTNHAGSTATQLSQQVDAASTTTTVATSDNDVFSDQQVTLTATVAVNAPGSGTPTGTVTFFSNNIQIGTPQPLTGYRPPVSRSCSRPRSIWSSTASPS